MADDLGVGDVGFMGSEYFETPNLDRLAAKGVVFSQSYMYPTCSPSRTALLTGRHSTATGVYNVPVLEKKKPGQNVYSRWTVARKHTLYSQPLRNAGYRLAHFGKWHIVGPNPKLEQSLFPFKRKLAQPKTGDLSWLPDHRSSVVRRFYPTGRGFHENYGGTWWGDPSRGHKKGYKSKSGGYRAPFANPFLQPKQNDAWLSDRLTDEAIGFIRRNKSQPFFVNLHYYAPHRPSVYRSEERYKHFLAKAPDLRTGQGAGRKKEIAKYATMVESIDQNVQRIVEELERLDLSENTIILFTSDNGYNGIQSTNRTLRGAKGTVYEGGIRVPTFAFWPGRIKPSRIVDPICGLDFFPTFLDLAEVSDFTGPLDGISFLPVLDKKKLPERPLFWHIASAYKHPACSVIRKGKWKLIQFLIDGRVELYNLETDPKEATNVADEEKEVKDQLLQELSHWRKQQKAKLPSDSILLH